MGVSQGVSPGIFYKLMSMRTTISGYTGSTRYCATQGRLTAGGCEQKERKDREREERWSRVKKKLRGAHMNSSHIVKYPCTLTPVGLFHHACAPVFFFFLLLFSPPPPLAVATRSRLCSRHRGRELADVASRRHWPRGVFRIYRP